MINSRYNSVINRLREFDSDNIDTIMLNQEAANIINRLLRERESHYKRMDDMEKTIEELINENKELKRTVRIKVRKRHK